MRFLIEDFFPGEIRQTNRILTSGKRKNEMRRHNDAPTLEWGCFWIKSDDRREGGSVEVRKLFSFFRWAYFLTTSREPFLKSRISLIKKRRRVEDPPMGRVGWDTFRSRFTDLTGDAHDPHSDAVPQKFTWYPNRDSNPQPRRAESKPCTLTAPQIRTVLCPRTLTELLRLPLAWMPGRKVSSERTRTHNLEYQWFARLPLRYCIVCSMC